jgi:hypothetical protein
MRFFTIMTMTTLMSLVFSSAVFSACTSASDCKSKADCDAFSATTNSSYAFSDGKCAEDKHAASTRCGDIAPQASKEDLSGKPDDKATGATGKSE